MVEGPDNETPRLSLEDVARAALELTAQPELGRLVARFQELVRAWAAPSAVLAAVKEPQRESGWRLVPALCLGSVPLAAERSLPRLVEEAPECLVRPTLVQPGEEVPGVKVRDNWVVPWWCEGESGLLVLRGVPRPYPPNLGDAVALLSAAVWPRVRGGPAARVEALVGELQAAAGRLEGEVTRQIERLQAVPPPAEAPPEAGRIAELEGELHAAREQSERATRERQEMRERQAQMGRALEEAGADRDRLRAEAERLASRVEALQSERAVAADRLEAGRRAYEAAEGRAQAGEEALAAARQELAAAQQELAAARQELATARQGEAAAQERMAAARQELSDARAAATAHTPSAAPAGLAEARQRLEEERARADQAEAQSKDLSQRWDGTRGALRVALDAVRRAPFLPPALRVSMGEAESLVGTGAERPTPWMRAALLDRDAVGLETLAAELEAGGIEVRLANHPEELALLLKTPDAAELNAAICDIMAFRPDQNVAGLLRAWDKEKPGLAFYLTYSADNPAEAERARRVPLSLTVGHLPRPLGATRLVETLDTLAKRRHKA